MVCPVWMNGWFVKQASYHCCKYLYPDSYWRHSEDTYKEFPQQPEGSTWYPQTKVSSQSPILSKGFRFRALLSPFLHFSVCGWLDCSEWSNNNFTSNAIWFCGLRFWLVANCRMPYHRSYSRFNVLSCDSDYCPPLAALNTAPSSLYGLAGEVQFQHIIPLFFILYNYYRLSSWVCQELFNLNKSRRQRQWSLYWCR